MTLQRKSILKNQGRLNCIDFPAMIHKTRGIVLRSVRYSDSSLVVTCFTESFGLQSYMASGARKTVKGYAQAPLLQPGSLLDMEVYHHPQRALQRIRECSRTFLYQRLFSDVALNSILVFMMEILQKTLRQPEPQEALFAFCEDCIRFLDEAPPEEASHFPLFFLLQYSTLLGLGLSQVDPEREQDPLLYLDLREGHFRSGLPDHAQVLDHTDTRHTLELLKIRHPSELKDFHFTRTDRRRLLARYVDYYRYHINDFGILKTVGIVQEVLG